MIQSAKTRPTTLINFRETPDLKYECIFENSECATVDFKRNETGLFCVLNRKEIRMNSTYGVNEKQYVKCPPKSKIRLVVTSESTNLKIETESPIAYIGNKDFGIPNENRYTVSDARKKIFVPVKLRFEEINVQYAPKGLYVLRNPNIN